MPFEEFEALAWRYWEEIPAEYREGVDGLVLERDAKRHPALPEVYTLGECLTETYPSEYGGPETIRSAVVLYYGSFFRVSRQAPGFDWEEEIWETLTHELQHHLESLANEAALEELDYAMDENFKRLEGEPFDPFFYRSGARVADGIWRVERDIFLEREYRSVEELRSAAQCDAQGRPGARTGFEWQGMRYEVALPAELGDICFIWLEDGLEPALQAGSAEEVYLVLVRRHGIIATVRAAFAGRRPEVVAERGVAERVDSM